jgi:formate dehydrogenase major subunit
MNAPHEHDLTQQAITFRLNGADAEALPGETIIEVADRLGVSIPRLCYSPGMRPDGNCRSCMVEIKGERVLAPSCCRTPAQGMDVQTGSARALHAQKMIVELLASDVPDRVYKPDSSLRGTKLGIARRFSRAGSPRPTCRIRRWRSTSTHASSARAAARVPRGAGERCHRLCLPR